MTDTNSPIADNLAQELAVVELAQLMREVRDLLTQIKPTVDAIPGALAAAQSNPLFKMLGRLG